MTAEREWSASHSSAQLVVLALLQADLPQQPELGPQHVEVGRRDLVKLHLPDHPSITHHVELYIVESNAMRMHKG